MKTKLTLCLSLGLLACSSEDAQREAHHADALTAPGGDQCAQLTAAGVDDLYAVLLDGLALADQDVLLHVGPNDDLVAPAGLRESFGLAVSRMDEHYAWFAVEGDADPAVISAFEAAVTGHVMSALVDELQQAVRMGVTSAVHNHSDEARAAVEVAFLAIELAGAIEVAGLRCYVDMYL